MISKITKSLSLLLLLNVFGCSFYPEFLDDPEIKKAAVEAFKDSAKTYELGSEYYNPELEFYYKIAVGARAIGVNGKAEVKGAAGPQKDKQTPTLDNVNTPVGLSDRREGYNPV